MLNLPGCAALLPSRPRSDHAHALQRVSGWKGQDCDWWNFVAPHVTCIARTVSCVVQSTCGLGPPLSSLPARALQVHSWYFRLLRLRRLCNVKLQTCRCYLLRGGELNRGRGLPWCCRAEAPCVGSARRYQPSVGWISEFMAPTRNAELSHARSLVSRAL